MASWSAEEFSLPMVSLFRCFAGQCLCEERTHNAHMPADHSLYDRCCEGSGSKVPGRQATTDRRRCWVAERVSWNDHMTMSRDDMVSFA